KLAIWHGVLQLILSIWLPALYLIPNFDYYRDYFYLALFDRQNVAAYGDLISDRDRLFFYLTGQAGEYMFGNFLWAYIATIAGGTIAAILRGDRPFVSRQVELLTLAAFMWLLPNLSTAKNMLFGAPFAFLLMFILVMALRSIFETLGGIRGVLGISALGLFFLFSGTSRVTVPNTPNSKDPNDIRATWAPAQDRLRDVMLGNSPNHYGRSVYLTNVGYYHVPTLWYWLLKKDPRLDWAFN